MPAPQHDRRTCRLSFSFTLSGILAQWHPQLRAPLRDIFIYGPEYGHKGPQRKIHLENFELTSILVFSAITVHAATKADASFLSVAGRYGSKQGLAPEHETFDACQAATRMSRWRYCESGAVRSVSLLLLAVSCSPHPAISRQWDLVIH